MKLVEVASKLLHVGKKQDKRHTPEEIAHEAFALVNAAGPIGQQAKAEYRRDFDLTQHQPGTVFRVELQNGHGMSVYSWHSVGCSGEQVPRVFFPRRKRNGEYNDQEVLNLEPDFRIGERSVTHSSFNVADTGVALWGFKPHKPSEFPIQSRFGLINQDDIFVPTKIEVIHAGHPVKEDVDEKVSSRIAVLKPVLQGTKA